LYTEAGGWRESGEGKGKGEKIRKMMSGEAEKEEGKRGRGRKEKGRTKRGVERKGKRVRYFSSEDSH